MTLPRAFRAMLADLGGLLLIPGAVAVTAIAVAAVFEEWTVVPGLGVAVAASAAFGFGLRQLGPADDDGLRAPLASVAVALGWIGAALLAALPFWLLSLGGGPETPTVVVFSDFSNAFFEGMSALTSTGLSMAPDASELPRALQWWRSALEWVGGMGIVLLALTLLGAQADTGALVGNELNVDEFMEEQDRPVRRLWAIYTIVTVLSIGAFWIAGMPLWEALNHGLAGIATGGFTVTSDSFQSYAPVLKAVGIGVMILGGLDFAVHSRVFFQREVGVLVKDPQTVGLWIALVGGGVLLWLATTVVGDDAGALDAAFQWTSALATAGFNSAVLSDWSGAALFWLVAAMFVGAAAGSTGGGIKIRRAVVLAADVAWQVREGYDDLTAEYRFAGETHEAKVAFTKLRKASALLVVFLVSLVLGTFALLLLVGDAHPPMTVLFEAASALGAVGLSAGVTGPDLGAPAKGVLITLMWLGRLEGMAALMLAAEVIAPFRNATSTDDAADAASDADGLSSA